MSGEVHYEDKKNEEKKKLQPFEIGDWINICSVRDTL